MSFILEYCLWKRIKEKRNKNDITRNIVKYKNRPSTSHIRDMVCRICLQTAHIPVTDKIGDYSILGAIKAVSDIMVANLDCYPKYICKNCLEELRVSLTFKRKCESSDYKLKKYLELKTQSSSLLFREKQNSAEMKRKKIIHKTRQQNTNITTNNSITDNNAFKKIKSFKCRPCNMVFINQDQLKEHRNKRSCVRQACPQCSNLVVNLKAHMQIKHEQNSTYPCHVCGKIYKSPTSLRCHLRIIHSDKYEYFCSLCPYKAKLRYYLVEHMRLHTGERPYLCSECPMTFVSKSNLNKHQAIHLKHKQFKCDQCTKEFPRKRNLTEHVESVHLKIKYQCQLCGRELCSRSKLLRHELHIHKRAKHKQTCFTRTIPNKNSHPNIEELGIQFLPITETGNLKNCNNA